MNPEIIEAIDKKEIQKIRMLAAELHEGTVGVLDMLSSADVEAQESLRQAMKLKLDEAMNHLRGQVADMEALIADLRITKGYQTADHRRIASHKIGLYLKEKELREQSRFRNKQ